MKNGKCKRDQQKYVSFIKSPFSLPKMKENLEKTSLDKCLVLKKAFQKKENFLVCELETSAEKISCLQGTVCVMDKVCVTKGNRNLKKLLNKKLQTTKIKLKKKTHKT